MLECADHVGIVAGEVRVTVQDEEARAEQRQGAPQRAAGPEQHAAIVGIHHLDAELAAIADHGLDLLGEMRDAQHDPADPVGPQQLELVDDERLAGDLDQRLGDRRGDRLEPRRQATREECHRQRHDTTTRVPSNSNRNRTSWRPAAAIAARSLA